MQNDDTINSNQLTMKSFLPAEDASYDPDANNNTVELKQRVDTTSYGQDVDNNTVELK